ncbi:MAG: Hpt domain-containing protein [Polyangiaceae bacterium]|nr:Hpt domain-containing protein [Polyangiaceae bacterium]
MAGGEERVLNLSYLVEATDGDEEFIGQLLHDYVKEMQPYVARMHALCDQGSVEELSLAAHTLKGASANVGASEVSETARRLEEKLRTGSINHCNPLLEQLNRQMAEVADTLETVALSQLIEPTGSK